MANVNLSPAKAAGRASARRHLDFSTALFTSVTAGVFLILIGCVATAAVLFSQGL